MSQTDDKKYQPRRYRDDGKRSKKVKMQNEAADQPIKNAADNASTAQEPVQAVRPDPEVPQQVDLSKAETIAAPDENVKFSEPDEAQDASAIAENDNAKDDTEEEIEIASDTDDEEYVDKTKVLPDEPFEYVIPKETFKQHYSRKHVSEHSGNTKTASKEEQQEADEGYIFISGKRRRKHRKHHRRHHKFKHLRTWQKVLIIAAAIILALVIAVSGTFLILREIGRRSMHNYDDFDVTTPTADEKGNEIIKVDNSGRVITYNGVSYELNEDVISVTFIGADEGTGDNADLQMADAIYTLALDTETGDMKILGISRDTMADVDLYSEQGKFIDTERMQMAFSYAYGSDKVTGGMNTMTSISRLFYGLPVDDYFAINMNALITLNDTIGGVTLTSSMTFTSPIDGRTINEGETVTLHGKEADYYVRHRDTKKLDSNNERMERQQEYIQAFLSSIIPAAKKDISVVTKLYDEIKVNSDTSLDLAKITYIASTAATKLNSASDIDYISLRGKITEGEYAEMNLTNEETMKAMLEVFYTPLAEVPDTTK